MLVIFPDFLGLGSPFCGKFITLAAKHFRRFLTDKISGLCARSFDNTSQAVRIFKHRTGTKVIIVEGLIVSERHKQRIAKAFKDSMCADI